MHDGGGDRVSAQGQPADSRVLPVAGEFADQPACLPDDNVTCPCTTASWRTRSANSSRSVLFKSGTATAPAEDPRGGARQASRHHPIGGGERLVLHARNDQHL